MEDKAITYKGWKITKDGKKWKLESESQTCWHNTLANALGYINEISAQQRRQRIANLRTTLKVCKELGECDDMCDLITEKINELENEK